MADAELIRHDGWAELVMNRPARRNAITGPMGAAMTECLAAVGEDPSIQALLLRGADGAFCSGLDLT
ncbi:MAG: enoyl-CoA hydratase/isomerase family protein, partial [Pseudomonadales bacterium]